MSQATVQHALRICVYDVRNDVHFIDNVIKLWTLAYSLRMMKRSAEAHIEFLPTDAGLVRAYLAISNDIAERGPLAAIRPVMYVYTADAIIEWIRMAIHHELIAHNGYMIPYLIMTNTARIAVAKLNDVAFAQNDGELDTHYTDRMIAKLDTALSCTFSRNIVHMTLSKSLPADAATMIAELVWPRLCPIDVFMTAGEILVGPFRIPRNANITVKQHPWALVYMLVTNGFMPAESGQDGLPDSIHSWLQTLALSYLPARKRAVLRLFSNAVVHAPPL